MCCPDDSEYDRTSGIESDPRYDALLAPWDGREEPFVYQESTGLHEATPFAVPLETINMLHVLVRRLQRDRSDMVVIESGTGQGYTTRRLGPLMRPEHDLYWVYESDDAWRVQLSLRDFWVRNLSCCIKEHATPDVGEIRSADLVIVDSDYPWAYTEFYGWFSARRDRSILVTTAPKPEDLDLIRDHEGLSSMYLGRGSRRVWVYAEHDEMDMVEEIWTGLLEREPAGL